MHAMANPTGSGSPWPYALAVLFTGHMVDAENRATPRFPASREAAVRAKIRNALIGLLPRDRSRCAGVAAGACGGDILFHEVCAELGVASEVRLALDPEAFEKSSVMMAGNAWVRRFHALIERTQNGHLRVMDNDAPTDTAENLWERANLWMIEEARRLAPDSVLLALWNGQGGDGPGGTEHMIRMARERGLRVLPPIAPLARRQPLDPLRLRPKSVHRAHDFINPIHDRRRFLHAV